LRDLASLAKVSVVVEQSLDSHLVTIDVREQTVDEILAVVARRAGVRLTKHGSLYFLGQVAREDRGFLVRRVRRLGKAELMEVARTVVSDMGSVAAYDDGLVVIADRAECLVRVSDLFDQVEAHQVPTWCVQLYVVSLSESDVHDLGMDCKPALDVSLAFASASHHSLTGLASIGPSTDLAGGLDAVMRAAKTRDTVSVLAEPLFYMCDGKSSRMNRGEKVLVPKKTITGNSGVAETTDFTPIDTGFIVELEIREQGPESLLVKTSVELSEITSVVEGLPQIANERYENAAIVRNGGVYLVGANPRQDRREAKALGLNFGDTTRQSSRLLQVWCRACRVGSPTLHVEQPFDVVSEGPELLPPMDAVEKEFAP
jgi:type II secretory pathway component GspD/PulD (secretin)